MADARAKELLDIGDRQFTKRQPLMGLWQETADNFFSVRAHFTREPQIGENFGDHQYDSYPELLRRMLGDSVSAMLRPRDRPWYKTITGIERVDKDTGNKRVLEEVTNRMRRRMYHSKSGFIGATKKTDHDFMTFGQGVIQVDENETRDRMFLKNFHLANVCWLENSEQEIDHAHIKDKMSARQMRSKFGDKSLHPSVKRACEKEPDRPFNYRIVILPTEEYDYRKSSRFKDNDEKRRQSGGKKLPFIACYVDSDNNHVIDEAPRLLFPLVIPRWVRLDGSAYAFSPATTIALPDGRLIQQLARILLEAGEKAIDPPMVADHESTSSGVNLGAGRVTYVQADAQRKVSDLLQAIDIRYDLNAGLAFRQDLREMLTKAFYIDKLTLPPVEGEKMTAFEVGRRLEEFVRQALPLFEPMEDEYNSKLLDAIYAQLEVLGEFNDLELTPDLRAAEIKWQFESPIQTASNRMMVEKFGEALKLHATGKEFGATSRLNLEQALSDAMTGTDMPATWNMTDDEWEAAKQAEQQQQQMAALAAQAAQAAEIAGQVGEAGQKLQEGGVLDAIGSQKALPAPSDPRMDALQAMYGAA